MALADQVRKDIPFPPLPEEPKQPEEQNVSDRGEGGSDGELQDNQENIQEEKEETPTGEQQSTNQPVSPSNDVHIRTLREKAALADQAQRERDELAQTLKELKEKLSPTQQPVKEEPVNINDDDLIEGKHYKALQQEIQETRKLIAEQQKQTIQSQQEARLKSELPDIDKVMTPENLQSLETLYPHYAQMILTSQADVYNKKKTAYDLLKSTGIYKDTTYDKEKEVAQRNTSKPKSAVAVSPQSGDSPLNQANAFANGLTEDLKKQIWKQMQETLRNR